MALRANFGISNTLDPTRGAQRALKSVGDIMNQRDALAQQALDNQRADARLGIAQAGEARALSDWELKQKQAEALRVSMLDPETSTDPRAAEGTSVGGDLIAINKRISDAYEANPAVFMEKYGNDMVKQSAGSIGLQKEITNAAQRDNVMSDPKDYIRRMADNAINMGADPKEALTLATAKAATMSTPAASSKLGKAKYDVEKDLVEKRISTVNKMFDKDSKTGKGKSQSFQNNAKGVVNVIESIRDKFPNTDWGSTAEGGDNLIARVKMLSEKGYHPDDIYAAMILNSSGENDAWFSKDREVQIKGMEESLVDLKLARKSGKGGSAQKALNSKYASDMKKLQGQLATSGKAYLNSMGGISTTPTSRQVADKVIADFYGADSVPDNPDKVSKDTKVVTTEIDKVVVETPKEIPIQKTIIKSYKPGMKVDEFDSDLEFFEAKAQHDKANQSNFLDDDADDLAITSWFKELGRDAFIPGHFARKFKDDPIVLVERATEAASVVPVGKALIIGGKLTAAGATAVKSLISNGFKKAAAERMIKSGSLKLLPRKPSVIQMPKGRIGAKQGITPPAMTP